MDGKRPASLSECAPSEWASVTNLSFLKRMVANLNGS